MLCNPHHTLTIISYSLFKFSPASKIAREFLGSEEKEESVFCPWLSSLKKYFIMQDRSSTVK